MPFVSAGPLCGRIRFGDELRYRLARRAPSSLIKGVEIFADGSARPGDGLPVNVVRPSSRTLLVGIGGGQAGVDRKNAPSYHPARTQVLDKLAHKIALAKAAMSILGEG